MPFTQKQVLDALTSIRDSNSTENLVTLGHVRGLELLDGRVLLTVACPDDDAMRSHISTVVVECLGEAAQALKLGEPVVNVEFCLPTDPRESVGTDGTIVEQDKRIPLKQASSSQTTDSGSTKATNPAIPGVDKVIAVGAGKGGVGKSTVAVNLAVGLARQGHAVGLMDADIYGPSLPTLMGLDALDVNLHRNRFQVFNVHGVKCMTIGKLVEPDKPLIWRGPMAHGAFKQLAEQTDWGELDYLILDMPPGTGDVPLTMSQLLSVTGAVVVCTPQKVAQDDALRAVRMFQQMKIDVLGIVENMSYFIGDDGKEYDIFGRGGAEMMAQRLGLPFLGGVPINMALRAHSDGGQPLRNFDEAIVGEQLVRAWERVVQQTTLQAQLADARLATSGPVLSVSD